MVDKIKLMEAEATGEDSESADAVTPAGGSPKKKNRPADLSKDVPDGKAEDVEDDVETPQGKNDVGLKEAMDRLFGGTELSEDFRTKSTAIMEAAVHARVKSITEELEAKFESDLTEQVGVAVSELTEKLDSYLDYVVENWMEDNAVAIETGYKVEMAESLFDSMKKVMSEHNISVDDSQRDAISEMENKVVATESKYNDMLEELLSLREEKETLERSLAFEAISEGMIETDAERFKVLSEGVNADNLKEYTKKLEAIKENYFTEAAVIKVDATDLLEEEVEQEKKVVAGDPLIQRYAAAIIARN